MASCQLETDVDCYAAEGHFGRSVPRCLARTIWSCMGVFWYDIGRQGHSRLRTGFQSACWTCYSAWGQDSQTPRSGRGKLANEGASIITPAGASSSGSCEISGRSGRNRSPTIPATLLAMPPLDGAMIKPQLMGISRIHSGCGLCGVCTDRVRGQNSFYLTITRPTMSTRRKTASICKMPRRSSRR